MAHVKCAKACHELVTSEASYVRTLETIVEVFARPMVQWATEDEQEGRGAGGGASVSEVRNIFGGVEMLLTMNSELLQSLQSCWEEHGGVLEEVHSSKVAALACAVASILERAASSTLKMYSPYVQSYAQLCRDCQQLREKRPRFAAALRVL